MKQGDLVVGSDYAYRTDSGYGDPSAARVRVTAAPSGGRAKVVVVDPGSGRQRLGGTAWKRGETVEISTQSILCAWEQWPDHAKRISEQQAALQAEQRRRAAEREREQADRTSPDADRPLPERYEDDEDFLVRKISETELDLLVTQYLQRLKFERATAAEVKRVLADLPTPLARDLVSGVPYGVRDGAEGSVGRVLAGATRLLETARCLDDDRNPDLAGLHDLVTDAHAAFVQAVCAEVEHEGARLILPYVPVMPSWLPERRRRVYAHLGWLRVAVGNTTGNRLHATSCHTIVSGGLLAADHVPLWQVLLEHPDRLCGVCDGPNLRDILAYAHFTAAVAVWEARDRTVVEPWQRAALLRLLAATAAGRAAAGEPDITLLARIVDVLAPEQPGEEGWAAFAFVVGNRWGTAAERLAQLSVDEREAARVLARDRITLLESVLPAAQRPDPLPESVTPEALRHRYMRYETWDDAGFLPHLIFGLPGVVR